jgi:chromosomal replication initiator protein
MEAEEKLWENISGELELQVPAASFHMFVELSWIAELDGEKVIIATPNVFVQNNLNKKCGAEIIEALKHNGYEHPVIEYIIGDRKKSSTVKPKKTSSRITAPEAATAPANNFTGGLNNKFTFENYVTGSNNELAYAAARRVAENPGRAYNPLFIYGGVGLGKTHLIQAVGNEILKTKPNLKVRYLATDDFMNDFTRHIRSKNIAEFQAKYRQLDVLIIDDIQFLAGKEKMEEEFFNTFNALHLKDKQIILAGDQHPSTISGLTDRMRSRLSSGMTVDIHMPPLEVRIAIIASKAAEHGVNINDDAVRLLAENIKTNVRELEGILTPIIAQCEIQGISADLEMVEGFLSGIKTTQTKHITPRQIIIKTAAYFNIKPEELCSPARDKYIAMPRHIASYLMRTELNESYPNIAHAVGRKDHTTIMSSFKKIDREVKLDLKLREEVNEIRERLYV